MQKFFNIFPLVNNKEKSLFWLQKVVELTLVVFRGPEDDEGV